MQTALIQFDAIISSIQREFFITYHVELDRSRKHPKFEKRMTKEGPHQIESKTIDLRSY